MKLPTIERYHAEKHGKLGACPWQSTAQQIKPGCKPCPIEFVVVDPFSHPVGYCRKHLATQLESDPRLRAALLVQLADKLL